MPKKFAGENSKAAAARARKEAIRKGEAERKKQAEEDAYWRDDDKGALRKQQRKEELERKRQEAAQRKQENRQAYDEEMNSLTSKASSSIKVTQAAIDAMKRLEEDRRKEEERERLLREKKIETESEHVEENVNRLEVDGESARSVSEAIKVLSVESPAVDRHPEKRLKAAYQAFEERMLPRLKEEHPTFRLSQLKQLLKKEWQKSPDNPLNQKILGIIQNGCDMINVAFVEPGLKLQKHPFEVQLTPTQVLEKLVPDADDRASLCLVFLGKLIPDDIKLSEVDGLKTGHTVYAMRRPQSDLSGKKVDWNKLSKCRAAFVEIKNYRPFRLKFLETISRNDMLERLFEKLPLLKRDVQACAAIRDYVVISWLLTDEKKAFAKAHPVVVDALFDILNDSNLLSATEEAASAVYHHAPDHQGSQAAAQPVPLITSQMLQEAMEQVFRTMGSAAVPVETTAASGSTTQFASGMAELLESGFTDVEQNARVLQETGGDVQQAIELLIALRESLSGGE